MYMLNVLSNRFLSLPLLASWLFLHAEAAAVPNREGIAPGTQPQADWAKMLGLRGRSESVSKIVPLKAGGFVLAGGTETWPWIAKTDSNGSVVWQKTTPRATYNWISDITETSDGGIVVVGQFEVQKDVTDGYDAWIAKFSSTGTILWQYTYGEPYVRDTFDSVQELADGGFAVAGRISVYSVRTAWLLRLDSVGKIVWQKAYGDGYWEGSTYCRLLSDGSLVLATTVDYEYYANGQKYEAAAVRMLKLDSSGEIIWQSVRGDAREDFSIVDVLPTSDGGCVVFGDVESSILYGDVDMWAIRLSRTGKKIWEYSYGSNLDDISRYILPNADGSFMLTGLTSSTDHDVGDAWCAKIKSGGAIVWQKAYGYDNVDWGSSITPTGDGGYILAVSSYSFDSSFGHPSDVMLMKLSAQGTTCNEIVKASKLSVVARNTPVMNKKVIVQDPDIPSKRLNAKPTAVSIPTTVLCN